MQAEILKDIVSFVAGDKAKGIVELLISKKNVNEFLIAKKLNLTINQTRNILYKLADEGLVSFMRKKDSKKGGWYIYFWTLNQDKALLKFRERLIALISNFKLNLESKKTARFYHCPNCNIEFNEENAVINNYSCPECGEVLELKDNSKEIAHIEREIIKHEKMLSETSEQISILHIKDEKNKVRRIKAEDKKKKVERAAKKVERANLKKAELQKTGKVSNKKITKSKKKK